MEEENIFENSLFAYFLYKSDDLDFSKLPVSIHIDNYILCLSKKTEFSKARMNNRIIVIIGLCVDSEGVLLDDIPGYILENSQSLEDVIVIERRFAGNMFYYI